MNLEVESMFNKSQVLNKGIFGHVEGYNKHDSTRTHALTIMCLSPTPRINLGTIIRVLWHPSGI